VHELVEAAQLGSGGGGSLRAGLMAGVVGHWFLMMRLDINLATQPYGTGADFGCAGARSWAWQPVTLIMLIRRFPPGQPRAKISADLQSGQSRDATRSAPKHRKSGSTQTAPRGDQSKFINPYPPQSFSWTQVFSDLELMMPHELHVTAIHPEVAKDNELQIKLIVLASLANGRSNWYTEWNSRPLLPASDRGREHQTGQNGDVTHFEIASAYIPQVTWLPLLPRRMREIRRLKTRGCGREKRWL